VRSAWAALALAPVGGVVAAEQTRGDPRRGLDLSVSCASCHEGDGRSLGYRLYPRIAGQNYEYLVNALTEFRRLERHQAYAFQMWDPTLHLTDQDVRDLAAFYSKLPW
jgi:cytochrome c553